MPASVGTRGRHSARATRDLLRRRRATIARFAVARAGGSGPAPVAVGAPASTPPFAPGSTSTSAPAPTPTAPPGSGRPAGPGRPRPRFRRRRIGYLALLLLWVVVNVQFWRWWLPHAADGAPALAATVSAALAYQAVVLPSVFWFFVGRIKRPPERPAPPGLRVAMITLCVPAVESTEVIEAQLRALRAVEHPHDSWILDEGGSVVVRDLAEHHGVRYFTRAGIERWNQPGPPHQRKTKAGNVNAWLSHVAELGEEYDVFVQLDVDHRPLPEYLDRVLGHFDDPEVAWVQAPSVCGNLDSWTARGLAEHEIVLQGPLQMGFYGHSGTPFIVGSHTSYRTDAVRRIGGFQPTRAEDHLDTVVLAAHGYRGVYVPEQIATGDGPEELGTYLRQQFAWAHSMITVLLRWTPRLLRRYSPAQAVQFLFAQTWYLLWSTTLLLLWLAPSVALLSEQRIAVAELADYVTYFLPVSLTGFLMWCFARPWFQPAGVGMTWRGAVLMVARWPVVLWALVSVLLRTEHSYMITPKRGRTGGSLPRTRTAVVFGPTAALVAIPLAVAWAADLSGRTATADSYVVLVLLNALVPLVALLVSLGGEVRGLARRGAGRRDALLAHGGILLLAAALTVALVATAVHLWGAIAAAVG
ncbi:glycosyltransferase family 2 protein [Patulibacter defluvii]|uniref:glycosyltransferase family 2 protein n=1 Tax=Patulibacter defluvii TaxID=3095358 RepID=UPI002A7571D8|nr:glycosyltransferase family 2 protein [Patulibacter sp. DM4]